MNLTWSHAFVNVSNLPEMLRFYCDVLGFKISDQTEQMAFISQLDDEHHQLAFYQTEDAGEALKRVGHFAFRIESFDALKDLYEKLTAEEPPASVSPITHGNTWSLYFLDPEGNGIEVFCDTPWQVAQPFSRPWDVNLNREELEKQTHDMIQAHLQSKSERTVH